MNGINNLTILLLITFSLITIKSYIILPFQELNTKKDDFKDVEELLSELSYLKLYSNFYLGKVPTQIAFFYRNDIDFLAMIKDEEKYSLPFKNNYNVKNSDSLNLNSFDSFNQLNLNNNSFYPASETFHFLMTEGEISSIYKEKNFQNIDIDANKYKLFSNINFLLTTPEYPPIEKFLGVIGLSYPNLDYNKMNFINELKEKSIISSTIWSVDFPDLEEDTLKKGNIIIGELPHIYKPNYYKEENYFKAKAQQSKETYIGWDIKLESSYIHAGDLKQKQNSISTSCPYLQTISIEFGSYLMYAPKKLFSQLKLIYFDDLFDKRICDYKKIKTYDDKVIVVYCDKKKFEYKYKSKFPSIIFEVKEFGKLELNYKDVFTTKNDKIYFMIAFLSKGLENTIKMGQILLYKYKFTFDYDNKEIGYYQTNLKTQKVVQRIQRTFRKKIFLIFIIFLIIIGGLFYYYKKGYIGNKKIPTFNQVNKIPLNENEGETPGIELKNEI